MRNLLTVLGSLITTKIAALGEFGRFVWAILRSLVSLPFGFRDVVRQLDEIGFKSLPIVLISTLAIGMVLVLQMSLSFTRFGARALVGPVISLAVMREMGPIIASLLVGGRVGAGITAEIGSMKVTEQIDAIKALGADPIKKLVVPRFIAALISFPLLAVVADCAGITGGMVMAKVELGIPPMQYVESLVNFVTVGDFMSGILKTVFFGMIVATVGTYVGMRAEGGTQGVGRATTVTVMVSLVLIIVADFFLTRLFMLF